MFDERKFGSGLQLSKMNLIHERTDEEDAPAGAAKEVFRRERIRQRIRIESVPLVRDGKDQVTAGVFEGDVDMPGRIVFVAVKHGIDGGLTHRHSDVKALVLVHASLSGQLVGGSFYLADTLDGRVEPETPPSSAGYAHQVFSASAGAGWQGRPAPMDLAGSFKSGRDCVKAESGKQRVPLSGAG